MADELKFPIGKTDEWEARQDAKKQADELERIPWEQQWLRDAMQKINDLTPDIKGKPFDPDWFLLRQHLEQASERLSDLQAKLEEKERELAALKRPLTDEEWKPIFGEEELGWWCDYGSPRAGYLRAHINAIITNRSQQAPATPEEK